jgi:hypothetical protein
MSTSAKILQSGTVVFAAFAVLSAIVCVVKGIVPLYAVEALLWAGLAVFWHVKQITSKVANYSVLCLAMAVSIGNAFSVGREYGAKGGYAVGYAKGVSEGHDKGYKEGHGAGWREGETDGVHYYLGDVESCLMLQDPKFKAIIHQEGAPILERSCANVAVAKAHHSEENARFQRNLARSVANMQRTCANNPGGKYTDIIGGVEREATCP